MESTTGLTSLAAIPATIVLCRTLLFPFYWKMRQTMPVFTLETQKMQICGMRMNLAMSRVPKRIKFFLSASRFSLFESDLKSGDPQENGKIDTLRNEFRDIRSNLFRNMPHPWILPNGLFMSANFYAFLMISKSASAPFVLPYLNMNIFTFSPELAAAATLFQFIAFKSGAEMGKMNSGGTGWF